MTSGLKKENGRETQGKDFMTIPCVTGYPVLKSVTLTTLGFYCKASGKAVIISLRVFRKHLRGVPPWWRPGMQKFMGENDEQSFQGDAVDSWEENRDRLHGDAVEFGHNWYPILSIRQSFGQKDPSNGLERRRIFKSTQTAGHSYYYYFYINFYFFSCLYFIFYFIILYWFCHTST